MIEFTSLTPLTFVCGCFFVGVVLMLLLCCLSDIFEL